jgi:hypothetical protein
LDDFDDEDEARFQRNMVLAEKPMDRNSTKLIRLDTDYSKQGSL